MKTVKKCIVIVAILILTFAIFGKFLNQNIATPFFKRTLSNSSNIVLEVLCLVLACLVVKILWIKRRSFEDMKINLNSNDVKKQKYIFLIIFLFLNIVIVVLFADPPGWDFGTIIYDLERQIKGTSDGLRAYLMRYPNNLLYTMLLFPIVYLFGADLTVGIVVVLNICILLLTFNFYYAVIYKITEHITITKVASIGFIMYLPLLYYNQTFYSDTIILPFVLAALYLLFEKNGHLTNNKKHFIEAHVLLFIALLFKPTIIIIILAISIVSLLYYKGKNKLFSLISLFCYTGMKVGMILLVALWSFFYPPLYGKNISEVGYPESAWICMSQNDASRGDYNFDDAAYIENLYQNQAASRETVDKAMKKCISERITSRSVLENLKFHFRKFAFSWSDPTNYSVHNLGLISGDGAQTSVETDVWKIDGVKSLTKNNLYLEQGPLAIIHYIYLNVYQNVIYLTVILLLLRHVFKNTQFQAGSFVILVSMIGTATFHLIWEARSRYLILICLLLLIFIFTNITDKKKLDWLSSNKHS